jgi:hypothetical protein
MLVIDDYLDRELFLAMRAALQSAAIPWLESQILRRKDMLHLLPSENLQYVHGFYLRKRGIFYSSKTIELIKPVLDCLKPVALIKVKLNRTTRKDRHIEYGLHVDTRRTGATTAIFYLNSNNGYTLFGNGEKVVSVENRLVLFDASTLHTGASCTDADERMVLNINMMMAGAIDDQRR